MATYTLKDANNNTIGSFTLPDPSGGSSGASFGLNVKDYGATGNGTTDDTAAINSALAALPDGGTLFFPNGRYAVSSLTLPARVVHLKGEGISQLTGAGTAIVGSGGVVIDTGTNTAGRFSSIKDMRIQAAAGNTALKVQNLGIFVSGVKCHGGAVGLEINNSVGVSYRDSQFYGDTFGLKIDPTGSLAVNQNLFDMILTYAPNGTATSVDGGANCLHNVFTLLDVEQSVTGLYSNGLQNHFINLYEEGCTSMAVNDTDTARSIFRNRRTVANSHWGSLSQLQDV